LVERSTNGLHPVEAAAAGAIDGDDPPLTEVASPGVNYRPAAPRERHVLVWADALHRGDTA
jgi:hypothetical protein